MKALIGNTITILFMSLTGMNTFAQNVSHNYINTTRTSYKSKIFVSQAIEGEYGSMKSNQSSDSNSLVASTSSSQAKWQGYNLTSTLGLEVMKFIQFNVAHSSINLRSTSSSLEKLDGSRLTGGVRLSFLAPVANLELGGGVIGTRYDYQKDLETSDFYGSGVYYSIGMNYFTSDQVSVFGIAKIIDEHSIKSGGSSSTNSLSMKSTNLGVGVSLWL
ncbi:MAG: hypothetical protein NT027_11320 [Proteobacteria bacterium]|nr:hypothetical protein [Pseudomonadota bacterium]